MTAPLPDAAATNWVDRSAPEALKPWLKLGRFDRPIGIWLLLLPCWQGLALAYSALGSQGSPLSWALGHLAWLIAAFTLGACLMRAAGCAFNDIVDREIDRQVFRTASRPVASGRISVKRAWLFVAACCLASLLILLTMNWTTVMLGAGSLLLVAAYPFMKRITWWPQAWLGFTFNWGVLMGFAAYTSAFPWSGMPFYWKTGALVFHAHAGMPGHLTLAALLLYLGGVFWTLGYDTIYALQDIEDDAMVGVKSSARRLGGSARVGVAVFYALAVLFAALAALAAGLGPLFFLGLVVYAGHLGLQVRRLRLDDPALALRLFKSNREAGLILLLALALGGLGPWS